VSQRFEAILANGCRSNDGHTCLRIVSTMQQTMMQILPAFFFEG